MSNLQCPFSKCYPQLYEDTKSPCTLTGFPTFRALRDHIWKYHSNLLGCDMCGHRFASAKRKNEHKDELNALKQKHYEQCHPDGGAGESPDSNLMITTLSEDGDEMIKLWKEEKGISDEQNYQSLCRSLFGDSIRVPADIGKLFTRLPSLPPSPTPFFSSIQ
jgi:ribosomal protein L37E